MYSKEKLQSLPRENLIKICKKNSIFYSSELDDSEIIANILKFYRRKSRFYAPPDEISKIMTKDGTDDNNGLFSDSATFISGDKPPLIPISAKMAKRRSVYLQQQESKDNDGDDVSLQDSNSNNVQSLSIDESKYKNTGSLISDPEKRSIIKGIVNNNLLLSSSFSNSVNNPFTNSTLAQSLRNSVTPSVFTKSNSNNNLFDSVSSKPPLSQTFTSANLLESISASTKNGRLSLLPEKPTPTPTPTPILEPLPSTINSAVDIMSKSISGSPITPQQLASTPSLLNLESALQGMQFSSPSQMSPSKSLKPKEDSEDIKMDDITISEISTTTDSNPTKPVEHVKAIDPREAKKQQKKRLSIIKLKEIANQKKQSGLSESKYQETSRPTPKINSHAQSQRKLNNTLKPDFNKIHNEQFSKMESIADYENKKKDMWAKLGFNNMPNFPTSNTTENGAKTESTGTGGSLLSNWLSNVGAGASTTTNTSSKTPTKSKPPIPSATTTSVPPKSPGKTNSLTNPTPISTSTTSIPPKSPGKSMTLVPPKSPKNVNSTSSVTTPIVATSTVTLLPPKPPLPSTAKSLDSTTSLSSTMTTQKPQSTISKPTTTTVNKLSATLKQKPTTTITKPEPKTEPSKKPPLPNIFSTKPASTSSLSSTLKPSTFTSNTVGTKTKTTLAVSKNTTTTEPLTNITNTPPKEQPTEKFNLLPTSKETETLPSSTVPRINSNGKVSNLKKRKSIKTIGTTISGIEKRAASVKKASATIKEKSILQRRIESTIGTSTALK
ncbi:hypothetical protein DLAC_11041 [Tieghemostelium lacteum]|uniref:Uncharacterized protein n=1 Tax=Tieghemostelium lacteum TaxID=361077 RepID=A0A151Z312_TIELA|nr:hypothetical protein DLAC_11041 [Tieghemostelium lacteum]|eukprot:KYQ88342.1 hypothetical protein DLAC_11041 [Tieghemostelium lacteum]